VTLREGLREGVEMEEEAVEETVHDWPGEFMSLLFGGKVSVVITGVVE
jgi:hypothetical protein